MNQSISSGGKQRGGARKGAGRKAGAATTKTREIADKAAKEGITPLEVMLNAMREHALAADKAPKASEARLKLMTAASAIAKDAAPYIHARLATIEHKGNADMPLQIIVQKFSE